MLHLMRKDISQDIVPPSIVPNPASVCKSSVHCRADMLPGLLSVAILIRIVHSPIADFKFSILF